MLRRGAPGLAERRAARGAQSAISRRLGLLEPLHLRPGEALRVERVHVDAVDGHADVVGQ